VAVVGTGDFGRNHARVYRELPGAELVGIVDTDAPRAARVAAEFSTGVFPNLESLAGHVDAASVAVPTVEHASVGCRVLELGIDALIEKPMAASLAEADELIRAASNAGRILQVGHLERFNPGIVAVLPAVNRPLYFEVHRLGVFTPRSLDIDVVYDVMIHDLDILLALVDAPVVDIKSIGIPVLTDKVDIAHARLDFATGAVANVTASRVSTERVRKLRFFQQHEYISVDFTRQDALRVRVAEPGLPLGGLQVEPAADPKFDFAILPSEREEPLRAELRAFLESVRTRRQPVVDGAAGRRALALADQVTAGILEHGRRVQLGAFAAPQANR
jgi:predicted dehydrogenase